MTYSDSNRRVEWYRHTYEVVDRHGKTIDLVKRAPVNYYVPRDKTDRQSSRLKSKRISVYSLTRTTQVWAHNNVYVNIYVGL